jgi:ribosome-associated translation inhibitor RaiA
MRDDEFHKVFSFQYTASQWKQIERVIDTQPGDHHKKHIREKLELLARQFRLVPQLDVHVPREANRTQAYDVIECCERLKNLLSETNVIREGSFYTAFKSRDEYDAIINEIEELEDAAKLVAGNNQPLSQKRGQADPRRDKYLAALCDVWVTEVHGRPTTSYRKGGHATGPFVIFLLSAALPALKQFTPDGARRFIRRWRRCMAV